MSKQRERNDHRLRRRLTLMHNGRAFLDRWGFCHERLGGFYLHHIADADPGIDLHDHPWAFVTIILRGGYTEQVNNVASASAQAKLAERVFEAQPGRTRRWARWSVHRMPLDIAHRITHAEPGTWTIVLRGPTRRVWGFYMPTGRVEWKVYPYDVRRPSTWKDNRP